MGNIYPLVMAGCFVTVQAGNRRSRRSSLFHFRFSNLGLSQIDFLGGGDGVESIQPFHRI